jgi:uncharacterized protein YkwD
VVLLLAVFAPSDAKSQRLTRAQSAATARNRALVAAINAVRTAHQLPQLQADVSLGRAASAHSHDMLRRGYFGHADFLSRMLRFHVRGRLFEENLAWSSGVFSGRRTVADWLASPPHRETLFDPKLHRIGVASPTGPFNGFAAATVVTADFAG